MAFSSDSMDFSITDKLPVFRSERFRTPFGTEKKLGLWVDRIGEGIDNESSLGKLRILGLWGAVLIEKGNGRFVTETCGTTDVSENDVMLLFPDEPHWYSPEKRWKTRFIVWGGPEAEIIRKIGFMNRNAPVVQDTSGAMIRAFDQLQDIMDFEDIGSALLRKSTLLNLIYNLYTGSRTGSVDSERGELLKNALNRIRNSLSAPPSVTELAELCHLSEPHFRRVFRSHTGRSPSRYIASLRISEAKRLLATGRTIKETALSLGYADEYYFMRVFRKETGMTAGQFRTSL